MGQKRRKRKSESELYKDAIQLLIPKFILENFEVSDIWEQKTNWVIELQEKEERVPQEINQSPDVVLDGFCHPIEVISHSFSLKPVYLQIYRRRWKRSNTDQHYSNTYDLTIKGIKMVPELGIFLKEEDRILSG